MARRGLHIAANLTLPIDVVTDTIALLAIKGAGKTYAFLKLAEEMIGAGLPVIIIDHVGVCWGLRSSADGKRAGLPVFVLGGEHADAPLEAAAGKIVAQWCVSTRAPVVLDLSLFKTKSDEQRFVADFCDTLYRKNRKPVHLMVDEADEYAPQKPKGQAAFSASAMEMIVRRGRARGIGITMATQRPAVLNKDVLTQAGTLLFGRVVSPHDRDAVGLWLKGQATAADLKAIDAGLPRMPQGRFHLWAPVRNLFEEITIAPRRTFDSSATPKPGQRRIVPKAIATVDIAALAADIKAARDQQAASDPRALRQRVAELEKALKAANNQVVHTLHAPAAARTITVPVLSARDRVTLRRIDQTLKGLSQGVTRNGDAYGTLLQSILSRFKEHPRDTQQRVMAPAGRVGHVPPTHVPAKSAGAPTPNRRGSVPRTAGAGDDASSASDASLGGAKLDVLRAAVQLGQVNQKQLGVLLGIRAKGSTLRAYLQQLTRTGRLNKVGEVYMPTAKGTADAGDFEPLPTDRAGLVAHWRTKLGNGQRRQVFDLLVANHSMTEENIATELNVTAKGSTIRAYLQQLARLGIIQREQGTVRLSEQFDAA
jgi:hypothetical protein